MSALSPKSTPIHQAQPLERHLSRAKSWTGWATVRFKQGAVQNHGNIFRPQVILFRFGQLRDIAKPHYDFAVFVDPKGMEMLSPCMISP